jgi:Domain of unknown function (DUF1833)
MSRSLSQEFIKAFLSRETGEAALLLLELNHPMLSDPVRFVLNTQPVTHQARQYEPMYFECSLPEQVADKVTGMKLRVDGIDRVMIEKLRSFDTPPTVTLKIVGTNDLDTVEMETAEFAWRIVTYGSHWLEGELEAPAVFQLNFPADYFSPAVAPGLFREF